MEGGWRTAPAAEPCTAPADGRLFLRCADDWTQLSDNDGEIEVVLRRAAEDGR